jgi:hypothetical protein
MTRQFSLVGQLIGADPVNFNSPIFKLSCFCKVSSAIKDAVKRLLK